MRFFLKPPKKVTIQGHDARLRRALRIGPYGPFTQSVSRSHGHFGAFRLLVLAVPGGKQAITGLGTGHGIPGRRLPGEMFR